MKLRSCIVDLFNFSDINIEKYLSHIFKIIFLLMTIFLVLHLYVLSSMYKLDVVSTDTFVITAIVYLLKFSIGLGLIRAFLEIPVALNKIYKAIQK
ncbi:MULTISPECIES: hypothetical protein [unclassified Francisella]|uniref:hypothetical protein n=1 Tax=unclassified Francisella TaxID=2610885 RepID=UPI002E31C60E|nr:MULTISPECIES: hypothetical protein [unclassified Francisella]MED7819856.1 hypothetical protein [Francisella sp. 19S2-4]MED7830680.1 hypothetical protein [Francisella sp. 19S2-10]